MEDLTYDSDYEDKDSSEAKEYKGYVHSIIIHSNNLPKTIIKKKGKKKKIVRRRDMK